MDKTILKKIMKAGPYLLIGILGFFLLRECSKNKSNKETIKMISVKTDTIYRNKIFKVIEYKDSLKPSTITIWKNAKPQFSKVVIKHDTLLLLSNKDSMIVNQLFLTTYPNNSKLISANFKLKSLDLTLLSIEGLTESKHFDIDVSKYNYIYSNNKLSYQKKSNLQFTPGLDFEFRPLNQLSDLNLYLKLKTLNFIYMAGVNGYLYPKFNKTGYDILLKIGYEFK